MTTDSSTGDWTPERIEEARERCERARGDTLDAIEAARVAAREDLPAALAEIERLRVIETHARDMMRTGNHHADGGGRSSITVDSEPFDALEALFAPVFLAERKARRFAKVKP